MCRPSRLAATLLVCLAAAAAQAAPFPGIGRAASAAEIAAWDIDVRPDFKGLPAGSGSVARGQVVWDARCASCHGTFGESNEVFSPLVGGTTAEDVRTGRVKSLRVPNLPRTTLMKVSTVSTLWDYIRRAMPWDSPKSLGVEDVYAVVAYLLHLGDILPADFVLSDRNIAEVQERMPNRHGMTREHGLWEVNGRPDVRGDACMRNCPVSGKVTSAMPDHARDAHGNLRDQIRPFGPVRGVNTSRTDAPTPAVPARSRQADLAQASGCLACHATDRRLVGPSFSEIAGRFRGDDGARARLSDKVRRGGVGTWGAVPMPAHPALAAGDIEFLVDWILAGAK